MKLRYNISEEIYREMLEMQIKRKNRTPIMLILTFLFTVGQLSVLIYMTLTTEITTATLLTLFGMSVLIIGLTIFYHFSTKMRAKIALNNFKYAKKIPDDFWKHHEFSLDKTLTVRFGSLKSQYNLSSINGYEELPSAFLIYCHGKVADIVPYSAIANKDDFIDAIKNAQQEVQEAIDEAYKASVPTDYKFSFSYCYTMNKYVSQQQEAYRKMYTTKGMYKVSFFLKLLVTLYAGGYIYSSTNIYGSIACYILIVLSNLQHIVTFSPISAITIKRGITPLAKTIKDPSTTVYITTTDVVIRSPQQALDIPIADIKAMRKIKGGVALYLSKTALLTIPAPKNDENGNYSDFVKFMNYKVN